LDIKQLQYFIQVANFNSFSRAADHLFISQPTFSKMIKNLETQLGVSLFDRSVKKINFNRCRTYAVGTSKVN
jgi:DNA-binding transcriptional LysR family regulator